MLLIAIYMFLASPLLPLPQHHIILPIRSLIYVELVFILFKTNLPCLVYSSLCTMLSFNLRESTSLLPSYRCVTHEALAFLNTSQIYIDIKGLNTRRSGLHMSWISITMLITPRIHGPIFVYSIALSLFWMHL